MNSIVFKKMYIPDNEAATGGLFEFAISDYMAEYSRVQESVEDFTIFGAVLEPGDVTDSFFELIERLTGANDDIKMLIFDVNRISDNDIAELRRFIEMYELKDVYEDRIVFARS